MGWAILAFLDTAMCLEALQIALKERTPMIINSDQGCQFTSSQWCEALAVSNIQISMDGKGRWVDNKYIERFWRSIKYEAVYLHSFDTLLEAKIALGKYIKFYNQKRADQALGYKTPDEIYFKQSDKQELREINLKKQYIEMEGGIRNSQIQAKFLS